MAARRNSTSSIMEHEEDFTLWRQWAENATLASADLMEEHIDWREERHMNMGAFNVEEDKWQIWAKQKRVSSCSKGSLLDDETVDTRVVRHMDLTRKTLR